MKHLNKLFYNIIVLFFIVIMGTAYADKTDKLGVYDRPDIYWIQLSNEFENVTKSMYKLAKIQLEITVKEREKSAFLKQTKNFKSLPPAVIIDIDDTILGSTNYAVYMKINNKEYLPKDWDKYVNQEVSAEIAGSVDFIKYAQSKGIEVFLVSNRTQNTYKATVNNLKKIGLDINKLEGKILLKNAQANWGSNKYSRYEEIAKNYYIAMIIGDNLTDFIEPFSKEISYKDYKKINTKYANYIGKYWIQIPATTYGSWQEIKDINKEIETVVIK